jgi:hypothetical protein
MQPPPAVNPYQTAQQMYAGQPYQQPQGFGAPPAQAYPPPGAPYQGYQGPPPPKGSYPPQHQQHSVVHVHMAPPPQSGAPSSAEEKYLDACEQSVRMGFIRKVYAILCAQLTVTLAFVLAFSYSIGLRDAVAKTPGVLIGAIVLTFVFLFALSCFPNVARTYPT